MNGIDVADPVALVAGLARKPVHTLTRDQLERYTSVLFDLWSAAVQERAERKKAPRSAGPLRLVAVDGVLTDAGTRCVRARKAARTRAINHNRRKGIS